MGQRRVAIRWLVLFGLLAAAFAGTVFSLNLTLYSASGFVSSYLDALARHDVDAAVILAKSGSAVSAGANRELLDPRALGNLNHIRLVSDTGQGGGRHLVTYSYNLSGTTDSTTFTVDYTGTRLGFFTTWRFVSSPLGVLSITPKHDAKFTVNGLALRSAAGPSVAKDYLVLTPGRYVLGHSSSYFTAVPIPVSLVTAGGRTAAAVDIEANAKFTRQVQKELNAYLDKCATQQVLLPTGCPFGKEMGNRIEGLPAWSMSTYPAVRILPGETPGDWVVPKTAAAAHLRVRVRSLFDGSVSTFDQDVAFTVRYLITFSPDGSLLITAQ
ncbi:MAG: hypothetical protein ACYCZY_00880 [Lacisediminihabitans sp.]